MLRKIEFASMKMSIGSFEVEYLAACKNSNENENMYDYYSGS